MMGDGMFRDHLDTSDRQGRREDVGRVSMDKGKTWTKVYEMTCKK